MLPACISQYCLSCATETIILQMPVSGTTKLCSVPMPHTQHGLAGVSVLQILTPGGLAQMPSPDVTQATSTSNPNDRSEQVTWPCPAHVQEGHTCPQNNII